MLSRVAERVYWMSRYLERVENAARLVTVYSELLLDLPEDAGLDWSVALNILGMDEAMTRLRRERRRTDFPSDQSTQHRLGIVLAQLCAGKCPHHA